MAAHDPDLSALISALRAVVGDEHVLDDPDLRASYEADWTGRWRGHTPAVVRPATTGDVAEVIRLCAAHGVAVVPQGGNTGLVGGSVPHHGEIVLSLTRMNRIDVYPADGRVYAGAGATLAAVQHAVARHGLSVGIDLASRDSATIGGMVATNAGGIHTVRYGPMRRQVHGLIAVLADGTQVEPRRGKLDQGGYDLAELMIGSEGTLGVVTEATLRLQPIAKHRVTALVGLSSLEEAVALLGPLRSLASLEAVELMFDRGVHLVAMHGGLPLPFYPLPPVLVLIECAASYDPGEELAAALDAQAQVAVGVDRADRARLWAYRERHTEAINAFGTPLKFDIGMWLDQLPQFLLRLDDDLMALWSEAIVIMFGHLAEGTLHINVLPPDDREGVSVEQVERHVMQNVLMHSGAISAEHGIGVAKRQWLPKAVHRSELKAMRAIKQALDPHGILNPNVLLPPAEGRP